MQFVELKNPRVLNLLEKFRYLYTEKYDVTKTNQHLKEGDLNGISEEYLREVVAMGRKHNGTPRGVSSYALKPEHYKGNNPQQYYKDFDEINNSLRNELGLDSSALSQLYPPKGFIDWHNNANASAYNVVFTWSETGDGWFKWYDIENDKIITMKDKKGWSCKVGYFASYSNDVPVTYHCAYTDCWRMTLSYTLGYNQDYWEDMIDYIQCED
jgi:hypothetical protein